MSSSDLASSLADRFGKRADNRFRPRSRASNICTSSPASWAC